MNFRLLYISIMLLCVNSIFAQESGDVLASNYSVNEILVEPEAPKKNIEESLWHNSSARTLKEGRTESGIFAPWRIGLKNKMELSIHPILFFVMPNAKLKKNWTIQNSNKLQVATEHGFTVPTILLNLLSKKGTGGIFPSTLKAPPILTLKNRIIISYFYHRDHSISLKAGMEFNLLHSMYNDFPTLDLLIAYPRTSSYSNFYTGEVEMAFTGVFVKKIGYDASVKMFLIPDENLTWVFEWNPKVYYNVSNKFRIMAGALVTTGNIPHEKAKYRALPVFDLQFSFAKKNKKSK